MTKQGTEYIDLGDTEYVKIPYSERKHVSFLVGSGFSVPCCMPTGRQLSNYLLNIEKSSITFDYAGKLAVSQDGIKHTIGSPFDYCLSFCSEAMKEYSKSHEFDYEQFYDFISRDGVYENQYQNLAKPYLSMFSDYHQLVYNMKTVYNQLIEYVFLH